MQRCSGAGPYGAGLWGAGPAVGHRQHQPSAGYLLKQPVWEQQGGSLQTVSSPQPPATVPTAIIVLCHLSLPIHNCPSALFPPASSHVTSDRQGKTLVSTEAISTPFLP